MQLAKTTTSQIDVWLNTSSRHISITMPIVESIVSNTWKILDNSKVELEVENIGVGLDCNLEHNDFRFSLLVSHENPLEISRFLSLLKVGCMSRAGILDITIEEHKGCN